MQALVEEQIRVIEILNETICYLMAENKEKEAVVNELLNKN